VGFELEKLAYFIQACCSPGAALVNTKHVDGLQNGRNLESKSVKRMPS
jgi:hypothetical protein